MTAFVVVAILAGVAVALQGQAMSAMTRAADTPTSVLVTYGGGAIIAAILWLARGARAAQLRSVSPLGWTAGLLGLVIVGGIGYAANRIGLSRTLIITVAAQLAAAMLIEHFGLLGATQKPADALKLAGLVMTIGGAWLVLR